MPDKPKRVGHYELIGDPLGQGGFGQAYLAKKDAQGLEKLVVVKLMLPEHAEYSSYVEMFRREAQMSLNLSHGNIAQVMDYGESDGRYFIVMEYVKGLSLKDMLRLRKKQNSDGLPWWYCVRIFADACKGLAYAHDWRDPKTEEFVGIVHRDISPDNMLISESGELKLVDFGIAGTIVPDPQTMGGIKGKFAYMPPEALDGERTGPPGDIYALGVSLYESIAGVRPYPQGLPDEELKKEIRNGRPTPLRERCPFVPEQLALIVHKAFAYNPSDRYRDCVSMQAELEDVLRVSGQTVTNFQIGQMVKELALGTSGMGATSLGGGGPRRSRPDLASPIHAPVVKGPTVATRRSRPDHIPPPESKAEAHSKESIESAIKRFLVGIRLIPSSAEEPTPPTLSDRSSGVGPVAARRRSFGRRARRLLRRWGRAALLVIAASTMTVVSMAILRPALLENATRPADADGTTGGTHDALAQPAIDPRPPPDAEAGSGSSLTGQLATSAATQGEGDVEPAPDEQEEAGGQRAKVEGNGPTPEPRPIKKKMQVGSLNVCVSPRPHPSVELMMKQGREQWTRGLGNDDCTGNMPTPSGPDVLVRLKDKIGARYGLWKCKPARERDGKSKCNISLATGSLRVEKPGSGWKHPDYTVSVPGLGSLDAIPVELKRLPEGKYRLKFGCNDTRCQPVSCEVKVKDGYITTMIAPQCETERYAKL
jgi:serine/threonine-protein kinase